MTEAQKKELAKLKKEVKNLTGRAKARVQSKIDRLEKPRLIDRLRVGDEKPVGSGKMKPKTRTPQKETTSDRKTGSGRGKMGRTERVEPVKADKPPARGKAKRKPVTSKPTDKSSDRKTGSGRGKMGRNPRGASDALSFLAPKGEISRTGRMKRSEKGRSKSRSRLLDTTGQTVDSEIVGRPTRKMQEERGVSFPTATKPKPKTTRTPAKPKPAAKTETPKPVAKPKPAAKTETPKTPAKPKPRPERPKTVDTRPKPKSEERKPDRRSMPAEDTTPRRPRRTSVEPVSNQEFGLDTLADRNKMKRFMKERFNITVTYDDDERQAREDRGEGPDGGGKAKGGLFTRRGGMYNKPVRKK